MALASVLAAARERLAAAERDARKAEADSHLAVINARWDAAAAIGREVRELERQAKQKPVKPVVRASPPAPPRAASLPDPRAFAGVLVRAINAATAPSRAKVERLEAEVAELRGELAAARRSERQARGKLAAVNSVARRRAA